VAAFKKYVVEDSIDVQEDSVSVLVCEGHQIKFSELKPLLEKMRFTLQAVSGGIRVVVHLTPSEVTETVTSRVAARAGTLPKKDYTLSAESLDGSTAAERERWKTLSVILWRCFDTADMPTFYQGVRCAVREGEIRSEEIKECLRSHAEDKGVVYAADADATTLYVKLW